MRLTHTQTNGITLIIIKIYIYIYTSKVARMLILVSDIMYIIIDDGPSLLGNLTLGNS